ncbi:hypothetical protein LTS18_005276 [Coniosporium uncinatum]|uniref:Uncharacterized protein n=1 Tax=Coniosporium uncinatum TaxID=93489 RepID=A0ACC3DCI9_9PEZI|nr:hypothetical protein LTS18_005276 [Coniosporium uncinatum]
MPRTVEDPVYDRKQILPRPPKSNPSNRIYSKPRPAIKLLYHYPLANVPNFSILALSVSFPPGGQTPPHRHGGASVAGMVLSGTGYNKMNDEPTKVLEKGETWYEAPGCHHRVSANASETEGLEILATFVVETSVVEEGGAGALVIVDEEYMDVVFPTT